MSRARIAAFWMLSCTWGIIMTMIGAIGAAVFLIMGHRPARVGYSYMFVIGQGWGAVSIGPFLWMSEGMAKQTEMRLHETGHSIQNCLWGVLFRFIVIIPSLLSAAVSSYAEHQSRWFERQATELGYKYCDF